MTFNKDFVFALAFAFAAGAGAFLVSGCGEENGLTPAKVEYKDQTFSLLVCDGNGNDPNSWDHDGAAACTLDWNGDGSGPNRVPVTYVYDEYPLVDGVAEQMKQGVPKGGDYWLWGTTPWTVIKTKPIIGSGSGVKEVWVKALYTYAYPPRIWFFFRWEDPSHTMQPVQPEEQVGKEPGLGGTMHYYWYQMGGFSIPADGFKDGRAWASHEDWLALAWSTWFLRNTKNKGVRDKAEHTPAKVGSYDWVLVETVPGFHSEGIKLLKGGGDVVYRTPEVYTDDPNSPYYDKYYPGAYCDFWYFSATRTNYNGRGWEGSAWLFDCHVDSKGIKKPPVGSNNNPKSLDEVLTFDAGVLGSEANGGVTGYPAFHSTEGPVFNPPGPTYLWKPTAVPFTPAPWPSEGGARIPGYLYKPPYGSVADVICRCRWQFPDQEYYEPWEGHNGERLKENYYGKDWHYTLEITREIGTVTKIDPEEDVLLGLFDPHPGR
ncbi:MAG: hypothetical protein V3W11_10425 [bacterium]